MSFKQLREQRGFQSQKELAREADVDQTTISQIELGKIRHCRYSTVVKLAKALRTQPDHIARLIDESVVV